MNSNFCKWYNAYTMIGIFGKKSTDESLQVPRLVGSRRKAGNEPRQSNWTTRQDERIETEMAAEHRRNALVNAFRYRGMLETRNESNEEDLRQRFLIELENKVARAIEADPTTFHHTLATLEDVTDAARATEIAFEPEMIGIKKRLSRIEEKLEKLHTVAA